MFRALAALLIALSLLPATAFGQERRMDVALAAETVTPRAGSTVDIALVMKPRPGWHGYWQNTGDAGTPDRVAWTLPPNTVVSPLRYPVPERLIVAGLMNYVYEKPYALLGRLKLPERLAPGTPVPIRVTIDYLVCSDTLCVPERAQVALQLEIGDGWHDRATTARFDGWRAALPRPLGAASHFATDGGTLSLSVPLAGIEAVTNAYFYPSTDGVIDYAASQKIGTSGDRLIFHLKRKPQARGPATLSGVVRVERPEGPLGLAIDATPGPVPDAARWITAEGKQWSAVSFLLVLLAAIAGGFILNAMPCVFPILSLKALSLARSGESEGAARKEALAYGAGVILTCVALGTAILLLRAGGEAAGWAFQLQNPRIILLLLLLVTAIGLNLAGLYDLPSLSLDHPGSPANKPSGAFMTGILAAVIATPCTGPFMGAALGSALVLPPVLGLSVFAGLGFGLALPFLAIAYVPALRARLPRPGKWMETLRRILAVPMLLTALGLGWVLGRQTGTGGMMLAIAAAMALGCALWWLGIRQAKGKGTVLAAVLLVLCAAVPLTLVGRVTDERRPVASLDPGFSELRLAELRRQNRPVFVYFTADWCLTCKVNEEAAINREAVRDAFRKKGIEVLVGDWTNGDPAIGRFLEAYGRSGVPLYLFYPAGGGQPRILPQILTVSTLTELG